MNAGSCPFCGIAADAGHSRIITQDEHAMVIRDAYPVTSGHTLIIPKRHVASYFTLSASEKTSMHALLEEAKIQLDMLHQPAAYNIGINDGPAAGQTVPHCHLHLIPRYYRDVADPRGGVRWVVAEKADYWSGHS